MATQRFTKSWRNPSRSYADLGMHVYWVVVTIISVAMLSATVNLAAPRDAAELAATQPTSR
jgi:hypothetical protein